MYAGPQTYDHSSAKILTDLKKLLEDPLVNL